MASTRHDQNDLEPASMGLASAVLEESSTSRSSDSQIYFQRYHLFCLGGRCMRNWAHLLTSQNELKAVSVLLCFPGVRESRTLDITSSSFSDHICVELDYHRPRFLLMVNRCSEVTILFTISMGHFGPPPSRDSLSLVARQCISCCGITPFSYPSARTGR